MISGIISHVLIYLYGTLRPAYFTYKAVCGLAVEEYKAWSKYWVVYALLICAEAITDVFVSWLPLYEEFKLFLVLWIVLAAPQTNVWIFDTIVQPLYSRRQKRFEELLARGKNQAIYGASTSLKLGMHWLRRTAMPMLCRMLRNYLQRFVCLLLGEHATKFFQAAHGNAQDTVKRREPVDSEFTEDELTEESESALADRRSPSKVSFRTSRERVKHSSFVKEPRNFEEEIVSMLRESKSDLRTKVLTAKELRRRSSRLSRLSAEA